MSHDKIRSAARKRMAETGEPYVVARRKVIRAVRHQLPPADVSEVAGVADLVNRTAKAADMFNRPGVADLVNRTAKAADMFNRPGVADLVNRTAKAAYIA